MAPGVRQISRCRPAGRCIESGAWRARRRHYSIHDSRRGPRGGGRQPAAVMNEARKAEWITHRERGSVALLRLMAFLSLKLGRRVSRVPLYWIAIYFFLFAPVARRNSLN